MLRCLLFLMLLPVGTLHATMAVRFDLDDFDRHSALIVVATVQSSEARWDAAGAAIWTHHRVSVSETLRGEHRATREFVTRGGVVGNVGQHVAGTGAFRVGGEYVLFLWRDAAGRDRLTGMAQGAFRVTEQDGVRRARNGFGGLRLVDPMTLQPLPPERQRPLDFTLTEMRDRFRKPAREGGE